MIETSMPLAIGNLFSSYRSINAVAARNDPAFTDRIFLKYRVNFPDECLQVLNGD